MGMKGIQNRMAGSMQNKKKSVLYINICMEQFDQKVYFLFVFHLILSISHLQNDMETT